MRWKFVGMDISVGFGDCVRVDLELLVGVHGDYVRAYISVGDFVFEAFLEVFGECWLGLEVF